MSYYTNGGDGGNSGGFFDWPSWPWSRRRDFYIPPLWHFHRALAGRRDEVVSDDGREDSHILEVEALDLCGRANSLDHQTNRYEVVDGSSFSGLLARRGWVVTLGVACRTGGRTFEVSRDRAKIIFEFGERPSVTKGTKGVAEVKVGGVNDNDDTSNWQATFIKKTGTRFDIRVSIPVTAPVGLWTVTVETWYGDRSWERKKYKAKEQPVYILFNPFHEKDPCYLPHAAGREEFLFSEVGKVYGGSHNNVLGRPWIFGQLRDVVLPAACHLLDNVSFLKDSERSDPVRVTRAISAMVNNVDDGGVLVGRWDGQYDDGTTPFEWTGSVPIIEEYMEKGRPVKYGQCWVFAGVVTTICRALGLPCRCVTNYVSAHDTDASLSVDRFYDENGDEVTIGDNDVGDSGSGPAGRSDSIWNFHVWNEVWMSRPDLPKEFGGWQVIDATPQEQSGSRYQCGPASVAAIRRGEVGLSFDAAFVFTQVNADVFIYVPDKDTRWGYRIAETSTDHVGKLIITQAVGHFSDDNENDYEVITEEYKPREGSASERLAMMRASRTSEASGLRDYPGRVNQDVFLKLIDLDKGKYGEPYKVSLYLHNQSHQDRLIRVVMTSISVFYTGVKAHVVKKGEGEFALKPGERETLTMEVEPEVYMPKTVEHCQFVNRFLVSVAQTRQVWHGEDDFVLLKPKLEVRASPANPRVNRVCRVSIRLTNPLSEDLTACVFAMESPGVTEPLKKRFRKIHAGETVEAEMQLRPWRGGATTLVATFNSNELYNITGTRKIHVLT